MFGTEKLIKVSIIWLALTLVVGSDNYSDRQNGNFLWNIFSRGKSFLFGNFRNSSRRTDNYNPSEYQEEPEHRGENELDNGVEVAYNAGDHNGGGGGWGWGWVPYGTKIVHKGDNMPLYSLIGGLSFASFLATALVLLTRRNGTFLRSSQRRKDGLFFRKNDVEHHGETDSENYEMIVRVPQFLHTLGKIVSPLWYIRQREIEKQPDKTLKAVPTSMEKIHMIDYNENRKSRKRI